MALRASRTGAARKNVRAASVPCRTRARWIAAPWRSGSPVHQAQVHCADHSLRRAASQTPEPEHDNACAESNSAGPGQQTRGNPLQVRRVAPLLALWHTSQVSYELLIGLRYTRAKRRNHFISFISLTSMMGIGLGVAALVVVLSVMNGFQKELRVRILGVASHVQLSGPGGQLQGWADAAQKARAHPQVVAAAP